MSGRVDDVCSEREREREREREERSEGGWMGEAVNQLFALDAYC